jgi:LysM repeat protein
MPSLWKRPLTRSPFSAKLGKATSFPRQLLFSSGAEGKNILTLKDSYIKRITRKTKGFLTDPFFYLGLASLILLSCASFLVKTAENSNVSMDSTREQALRASEVSQKTFVESSNFHPESPDLYLVQKNTIMSFNLPMVVTPQVLGVILGESEPTVNKEVIEYEVKQGDSLTQIAENFGVSLNTVLWANNLSKNSTLKLGQKLVILPISGLIYQVKNGDTISAIAQKYKAATDDIVSFNELASQDDIFIGDILIVPGGTMTVVSSPVYTQSNTIPLASSYFIAPISAPYKITQGLHWYNAIDFNHGNGSCGDYILAAAGGVVQRVRYGWNGGGGNYITILHPNGVVTYYGHILNSLVSPGDTVYQGQLIALMGGDRATQGVGAGVSTGCHVHFEVVGASNPFSK